MMDRKKVNQLKHSIDENKRINYKILSEISLLKENIIKGEEENQKGLEILEKSLDDKKIKEFEFQKKFWAYNDELINKRKIEKKKKEEFENSILVLESLKKQLNDRKSFYIQKIQEFNQLKKHKEDMEKSGSFVAMLKSQNMVHEDKKKNVRENSHNSEAQKSNHKNPQEDKSNDVSLSYIYRERKSSILVQNTQKTSSVNKEIKSQTCYPCN